MFYVAWLCKAITVHKKKYDVLSTGCFSVLLNLVTLAKLSYFFHSYSLFSTTFIPNKLKAVVEGTSRKVHSYK